MKIKGIDSGFKDVDIPKRTVCGYFAHFGSKDLAGDVIEKGAFADTIRERGPKGSGLIKHLLDHDKKKAVATIQVLEEDSTGLYYEAKAGRHSAGEDFLLMVEDGIINQHSFGYHVVKETKTADANVLQKLFMTEGSSLQFLGCNPNTPIVGVKSLEDILSELEALENALKNGKYTDDTFRAIGERIRVIYALFDVNTAKRNIFQLMAIEAGKTNP